MTTATTVRLGDVIASPEAAHAAHSAGDEDAAAEAVSVALYAARRLDVVEPEVLDDMIVQMRGMREFIEGRLAAAR